MMALGACEVPAVPDSGAGSSDAATAAATASGQALAFGDVAAACGLSEASLGTTIATQAGYALHDTAPTSTGPRTHYVTGFADGCPRRMTAALALFGDLATHETMRYESSQVPYSASDTAYEALKARICGVASGQPCGERLDRLAADTVFLSLYPAFGAEDHTDLLLSGGEVLAKDL